MVHYYLVTDTVAGVTYPAQTKREAWDSVTYIAGPDADVDMLVIALYSGNLPITDGHNGVHIGYIEEV